MKRRLLVTAMLATTLVLSAGTAAADSVEEAAEHFRQGVELYRENHLAAALVEFRRANELSPSYRILYNIGQTEAGLGNYLEAIAAFEQYLSSGGQQISAARRSEVGEDLARLRLRVGSLMVRSNVDGALLTVDGAPRGRLPLTETIPMNVGSHTIELRHGDRRQVATIDLPGGETKEVTVDFPPAPVASDVPPSSPVVRTEKSYTPMWISFGVAAAAAAGAVTFGVIAFNKDRDHEDELSVPHSRSYDAEGEASNIQRLSLVSDILTSVAVVSAAVGVYFAIRPPTHTTTARVGMGPGSLRFITTF